MRPIPKIAVDFIAEHEGCKLKAYQDVVGVWTIGYGHIQGVAAGQVISLAQARLFLSADLIDTEAKLRSRIGDIVEALTENQFAALLSFVFNLGSGDPRKPEWTIWKRLKARQFDQVPVEMIKFVNAGGKKVQGLVNRRADEVKLWSTDEPGSTAEAVPSTVTRSEPTPPTPADPHPPQRSGQIIAGVTAAIAGVPAAVGQVTQAVAPYAAQSDIVAKIVSTLAVVAAGAVVVGLVLSWMKKREARN